VTGASPVGIPGPWRHGSVSANGIRLHTVECGRGPLVVLLHGFPEFWWSWRHQLTGLADAGFRAVAVDLRGYGDSDKPPRGYDLWTLAGDVAGLIRALGERRSVVVGHDWGGLVGWTLSALHPRLVSTLVVVGAAHPLAARRALLTSAAQARAWRRVAGFQVPIRPERALRADGAALVGRLLRSWSGTGWAAAPEFAEVVRRNRAAMLMPGVAHCALEYFRWAVRSQARADGRRFAAEVRHPVAAPVLHLHGADDPWLLEPTAAASAAWVAGHGFHVLAGCGHFPHEEAPRATTGLIADFLTSA
jgi:pimeloyl-ACP methyl ester carboxylesterase